MRQRRKNRKLRAFTIIVAVIFGLASTLIAVHAPALSLQPTLSSVAAMQTTPATALAWPAYGQSAVGADGFGVLDSSGSKTPAPTASTAKIMTAYAILRVKPLSVGQQADPLIQITQADVDIFNDYIRKDGSVTLVANGEQISEYQALQAILLPSSNNLADSTAIWAFGSMQSYLSYANNLATELGLHDTHIADASGYSPQTVSTARDMVRLSIAAMRDPVFKEIVGQVSADVPVAGKIYNVNGLLGHENMIGLKTGSTPEAGGVFVSAATHEVSGRTITIITVIMGGPSLVRSMLDTLPLIRSAKQNFAAETVLNKNATVGYYYAPWLNRQIALKTNADVRLVKWRGSKVTTTSNIQTMKVPLQAGRAIGSVTVSSAGAKTQVAVVSSENIPAPSISWRVHHPF